MSRSIEMQNKNLGLKACVSRSASGINAVQPIYCYPLALSFIVYPFAQSDLIDQAIDQYAKQGWRSRNKSWSRNLIFKVSVSRLGEKFGSRSRSNWISVSKQKLRLETSFIGTALQLLASCQGRSRASMFITESKPISLLRHFLSDADP